VSVTHTAIPKGAFASKMLPCATCATSVLLCGVKPLKQVVGIAEQAELKVTSALLPLSFEWEKLWLHGWCNDGNEPS